MLMAKKVGTRQVLVVDEGMCSFISLDFFLALSVSHVFRETTKPLQNLVRLLCLGINFNLQMKFWILFETGTLNEWSTGPVFS